MFLNIVKRSGLLLLYYNLYITNIKLYFQKVNLIRHYSNKITNMNIIPIEALQDNYMYLIVDPATKECAAVDPVEPLIV